MYLGLSGTSTVTPPTVFETSFGCVSGCCESDLGRMALFFLNLFLVRFFGIITAPNDLVIREDCPSQSLMYGLGGFVHTLGQV